jgi:hypothetical protein
MPDYFLWRLLRGRSEKCRYGILCKCVSPCSLLYEMKASSRVVVDCTLRLSGGGEMCLSTLNLRLLEELDIIAKLNL